MKTIYENPELHVLGAVVDDIITTSGETRKPVTNAGAQTSEEEGYSWDSMW